jgi:hypothetical protein
MIMAKKKEPRPCEATRPVPAGVEGQDLARTATELVMAGLSVLMLGSMHSIQFHHLRHHKHRMAAAVRSP